MPTDVPTKSPRAAGTESAFAALELTGLGRDYGERAAHSCRRRKRGVWHAVGVRGRRDGGKLMRIIFLCCLAFANLCTDTHAAGVLGQDLRHVGVDIPIHVRLHFVKIEDRRPVRMLVEVVADDVLQDHFAAIKVCEPDRVSERVVGVTGKISWKENFLESYHCCPLLECQLRWTRPLLCTRRSRCMDRTKSNIDAGLSKPGPVDPQLRFAQLSQMDVCEKYQLTRCHLVQRVLLHRPGCAYEVNSSSPQSRGNGNRHSPGRHEHVSLPG